jgi:hypothetical protein
MLAHEAHHRLADAEVMARTLNAKQVYLSASVVVAKADPYAKS